jgi:hypothetical protein
MKTYIKNKNTSNIIEFSQPYHLLSGNYTQEPFALCTQAEIDAYELEKAKDAKIAQCINYLQQTDWQVIRLCDPTSDEPLKEGVAENRALARSLQDEIKACETLEELNNININFE